MLENARIVYEDRVADVDRYCTFLQRLIDEKPTLRYLRPDGSQHEEAIDLDLTHTLKANAYLMLYNLVEATIRQAMDSIRRAIESGGHDFNHLHTDLQRHLIKCMKDDDARGGLLKSLLPLERAILAAGFESGRLFGGNIHHKTLKEAADAIGFSVETEAAITDSGKRLETVKKRRNALAHGNQSFLECGRDTAIEDIVGIKDEVEAYLAQILDNIEAWLKAGGYLATPPGAQ